MLQDGDGTMLRHDTGPGTAISRSVPRYLCRWHERGEKWNFKKWRERQERSRGEQIKLEEK
jgi:hypothetical protein